MGADERITTRKSREHSPPVSNIFNEEDAVKNKEGVVYHPAEPDVVYGPREAIEKIRCHPDGPIYFAYVFPAWASQPPYFWRMAKQ